MNNVVGVDLLGKGGRKLKGMSVLLVFLYDLNLNDIAVESLLLSKQVSVAFEDIWVLWKEKIFA